MKKISTLIIFLSLLFFGCKEDFWYENNSGVQVSAGFFNSRSTLSEQGDVTHVSWDVNDAIRLVTENGENIKYITNNSGANVKFVAANTAEVLQEDYDKTVYAFYPYSCDISDKIISLPNLSLQGTDKSAGKFDALYTSSKIVNNSLSLQFKHVFAFIKLTLNIEDIADYDNIKIVSNEALNNGDQGKFNIETSEIVSSSNTLPNDKIIKYSYTPKDLEGKSKITYYIAIYPQTSNAKISILINNSTSGDEISIIKKNAPSSGILPGNVYDLTAKYDPDREALVELYNSTNGDNWTNHENWCTDKPLSQWHGIRTTIINGKERVASIYLERNNLNGELPSEIGYLDKLEYITIYENKLSGELPSTFSRLKNLECIYAYNNNFTGSIPEGLCEMTKLKTIYFGSNQLSGCIPENIGDLTNLEKFSLYNNNLTGNLPESVVNLQSIKSFTVFGNRLSGTISDKIINSEFWKKIDPYSYVLKQQEGFHLVYSMYNSTDYSKDGEIITLQKKSVGKGIDLVFMGDGFIDKDMNEGGKYELKMKEALEQFFKLEPYKSFRNRFNAYAIKVVSQNEDWIYGYKHTLNENTSVCLEYAKKVLGATAQHPYVNVIYNVNPNQTVGRSYTQMWTDGTYVAFMMENDTDNRMVFVHEVCGHGIGKLGDEYVEFTGERISQTWISYLDHMHAMKWFLNVDYINDPKTVAWARFLSDSRYDIEQLGIYEGAFYGSFGEYRPSENSMMRHNDTPFNAPSREAIYNAIMRESENNWVENHEEFVRYDAINRVSPKSRSAVYNKEDVEKQKKYHRSPVIIKGSWKDGLNKKSISVPFR